MQKERGPSKDSPFLLNEVVGFARSSDVSSLEHLLTPSPMNEQQVSGLMRRGTIQHVVGTKRLNSARFWWNSRHRSRSFLAQKGLYIHHR